MVRCVRHMASVVAFSHLTMIVAYACVSGEELAHLLPDVVHDVLRPLDDPPEDLSAWHVSPGVSLAVESTKERQLPVLKIHYSLTKGAVAVHADRAVPKQPVTSIGDDSLPPLGERLRFWLQGDSSGNLLTVSHYDRREGKWRTQAVLPLTNRCWQHVEIPATEPDYLFYRTTMAFRFAITRPDGGKPAEGSIRIAVLELVSSQPLPLPLMPTKLPSGPLFTSWGGVEQQQAMAAGRLGVRLHSVPVLFSADHAEPFLRQVEVVGVQMRWCHDAGMLAGLQFFNQPPKVWVKVHKDLFPLNSKRVPYCDHYFGGCALSPWNPVVQKLWRQHITATLRHLKQCDMLRYVDSVFLSPGEEGELCFNWDDVWAFDEYAIAAYRSYLRRCYGDRIETLNADWGTRYSNFETIAPPHDFVPNREHWVFQDFYRLSMLRWCVQLADAVREVFVPKYWNWMPHALPAYPGRYFSARYPIYYVDNLRRLGLIDIAHLPAIDWQGIEDMKYLKTLGVRVIGELDVVPTPDRLRVTFDNSRKYGYDGVYLGVLPNLLTNGKPTPTGKVCSELMKNY